MAPSVWKPVRFSLLVYLICLFFIAVVILPIPHQLACGKAAGFPTGVPDLSLVSPCAFLSPRDAC